MGTFTELRIVSVFSHKLELFLLVYSIHFIWLWEIFWSDVNELQREEIWLIRLREKKKHWSIHANTFWTIRNALKIDIYSSKCYRSEWWEKKKSKSFAFHFAKWICIRYDARSFQWSMNRTRADYTMNYHILLNILLRAHTLNWWFCLNALVSFIHYSGTFTQKCALSECDCVAQMWNNTLSFIKNAMKRIDKPVSTMYLTHSSTYTCTFKHHHHHRRLLFVFHNIIDKMPNRLLNDSNVH